MNAAIRLGLLTATFATRSFGQCGFSYDAAEGLRLEEAGWILPGDAVSATQSFSDGALDFASGGTFSYYYAATCVPDFDYTEGFEVSAELKVIDSPYVEFGNGARRTGFWLASGADRNGRYVSVAIGNDIVYISTDTNNNVCCGFDSAAYDTRGAFHRYRLSTSGGVAKLFIDDLEILSVPLGPPGVASGIWWGDGTQYASGHVLIRNYSFGADRVASICSQPSSLLSCPSVNTTLSTHAAGTGPFAYRWQSLTNSTWIDLAEGDNPTNNGNGGTFTATGTATDTLTVGGWIDNPEDTPLSLEHQFRCVVTNACGSIESNPATLTLCPPDFDCDGFVSGADFDNFVLAFEEGNPRADFDGDGFITGLDFDLFVQQFEQGC